ncbi:hypothetical protein PsAD14_05623 [Pseudovibrio sp. Ad14]|nr:hypothetical protein PsW74_03538 [Pseudovibrio sp. W74]KZL04165.1 hypothetical protein PsAD14_05623 [Pseudovibrio sp. Ad14]
MLAVYPLSLCRTERSGSPVSRVKIVGICEYRFGSGIEFRLGEKRNIDVLTYVMI